MKIFITDSILAGNILGAEAIAAVGMGCNAAPLFGIFYSERDKVSLKRTMWEALKLGLVFCIS